MLRSEGCDPIHGERELKIDGLLGPERAVIVEDGDALLGRHEIGPLLSGDAPNEVEDRLFRRRIIPGG